MGARSKGNEELRENVARIAARAGGLLKPVALPLAILAVYCACAWGLWLYGANRAGRPAVPRVDARQCPWLSPADLAAINYGVEMGSQASLFDRGICDQVAGCYGGNPWVERVVAVRRHFPDRVDVELAIRKPFASVCRGGYYHVVDRLGCRLPVTPSSRPDSRWPVIEGVTAAPPAAGEFWDDECLNDSLRLAELLDEVLSRRGQSARLTAIEASKPSGGFDLRPQMVAHTAAGMAIDWGSFNESRSKAFPSASEKREELERQLKLLPDLSAVSCIRVRYREGVVVPREAPIAAGAVGMIH